MTKRQEQLINLLLREPGWITAGSLADLLGVTPRSVRSYIAQLNARSPAAGTATGSAPDAHTTLPIESGPAGYRADRAALAALRSESARTSTRDRLHGLVRELLEAQTGIDLRRTAQRLYVSEATVESDLVRVRELLTGTGVTVQRSGSRALLVGDELAQRRLVSKLAHEEMERGSFDGEGLRRAAGLGSLEAESFGPFKRELAAQLAEQGYYVNEFASTDVVLHVAIAADRVSHGHPLEGTHLPPSAQQERLAGVVGALAFQHFGVSLGQGDLQHLASLVLTRVVASDGSAGTEVPLDAEVERAVILAVGHAAEEYLVDIAHADFIRRLSLHVQNLVHRAREQAWSRNPLTKSLKATYPMIFQVAVSIASDIGEQLNVAIREDEIAYIAMHVGGRLERSRRAEAALTATIVCPGYYELHDLLRSRLDESLGPGIEVTAVETRVDPDWAAMDTDLVLTTIEPPVPDERTVQLAPFVTDADMERISAVASKRRRTRRLTRLRGELERYLSPEAFIRPLRAKDEEDAIRQLSAPLVARGIIDEDYVLGTIERERLSSTAFTEALAVPHALTMTARRTALSIGIAEGSISWGEGRIQVVALAAFSESERDAFQTIFEQLVEVLSERESLQRILRRGTDFTKFLDELVAVIDG